MIFSKTLRALLALSLFQQADTQTVTVTIGQSGSNVFMEIAGSLTVLPPNLVDSSDINQFFLINGGQTFVTLAATVSCKYRIDFMFVVASCNVTGHLHCMASRVYTIVHVLD